MLCLFELSFATTVAVNEQIHLHRLACYSAAVIPTATASLHKHYY